MKREIFFSKDKPMTEYEFSTSRGRYIKFRGQVIAEAVDQVRSAEFGEFTYFLTVYRVHLPDGDPPQFVAAIAASCYRLNIDYLVIEECRNLRRAEDFFFVHECSDFWHDRSERPPADVDTSFLGDLLDPVFLSLTHLVLEECQRTGVDPLYRPHPPVAEAVARLSLWSRLTAVFSKP